MVMVKESNARVERLRWQLLAAVSGIGVAAVTCGGQSSTDEKRTSDPKGGASGAGDRGGASGAGTLGGSGGASGTSTGGDSSGAGGESGGGNPTGGQGPSGGTAGASGGPGRALGECENPRAHNGLIRCEDGYVHRPTATECPFPPRDGGAGGGGESGGAGAAARRFGCATDDDCGANGYCVYDLVDANVCVQAECQSDADCPDAHVCACETFDDVAGIGQCRPASCTTDDDCEGAALCISPLTVSGCFSAQATVFHCQSTADECWGSETCETSPPECMRDTATSRFVCNPNAESCGRPFIVGGVARRASAVHATDESWCEDSGCSESAFAELSESERLEIARHFTDAGLMEHASIAAFARFSLQLLALGAPPHLVGDAVRAMADETRHARVCFGLARRYGMTLVGPGPLAMDGALERVDLLDVARLVIVEGCIGETVAALEASFAAGEASDPELRRALESIADDETRHAALAFRFLAWAAEREPRVAQLFERSIGEARSLATEPSGRAPNERSRRLARHGVLDQAARGEARRRALNEVIPSLFALAEPIRELEQRVPAQVVA